MQTSLKIRPVSMSTHLFPMLYQCETEKTLRRSKSEVGICEAPKCYRLSYIWQKHLTYGIYGTSAHLLPLQPGLASMLCVQVGLRESQAHYCKIFSHFLGKAKQKKKNATSNCFFSPKDGKNLTGAKHHWTCLVCFYHRPFKRR